MVLKHENGKYLQAAVRNESQVKFILTDALEKARVIDIKDLIWYNVRGYKVKPFWVYIENRVMKEGGMVLNA